MLVHLTRLKYGIGNSSFLVGSGLR